MSKVGVRYRLVTVGRRASTVSEHVSSVVLASDEVEGHLEIEAEWHRRAGWEVVELVRGDGHRLLDCSRGSSRRLIQARAFGPMEDA